MAASKCWCLLVLQHLKNWNLQLCFLVFTCTWGSLTGSLISLCVCITICCKDLAFSCLVTSPSTDTFFQRSLGKGTPLCAVIIHKRSHQTVSPHFSFLPPCFISLATVFGTLLSSVLSLVFPLPFITHQETTTKTKPGCLAKWPFYCRIFSSGSILWWQNGKSLKAGAILICNLSSRPGIFWIFVKYYMWHIIKLGGNNSRNTLFSLFVLLVFIFSGWWK